MIKVINAFSAMSQIEEDYPITSYQSEKFRDNQIVSKGEISQVLNSIIKTLNQMDKQTVVILSNIHIPLVVYDSIEQQ